MIIPKQMLMALVSAGGAFGLTIFSAAADSQVPPPPPSLPELAETTGPALDELFDFLPHIVAKFDGQTITDDDVKESVPADLLAKFAQGQAPNKKTLHEIAFSVTQQLINEKVLIRASQEAGFEPDEEAARRKIDTIEKKVGPENFAAGLKHQGLNRDQLCQRFARQMAVNRWIDQSILSKVDTSEDALRTLYQEKKQQLQTPERVTVSHILIKADADKHQEAREKAGKIQEQIKAGADFKQLARDHSECASSKDGGELGIVRRGETVEPFEKVAFSLAPGAISDVIETRYGYHILKVHKHMMPEPIPFEKARQNLKHALQQQALHAALTKAINEGRRKASIEVMIAQE